MDPLSGVRSVIANAREMLAKYNLSGIGAPVDSTAAVGSVYRDTSTIPATVWVKQKAGWVKVLQGATE